MLVITENNQIVSIDKKLLNLTNTDLYTISNIVNTLDLQLSSLKNEEIEINDLSFNVKEIDTISINDIKIFELIIKETKETLQEESTPLEVPKIEIPITNEEVLPKIEENDLSNIKADLLGEKEKLISKEETFIPTEEINIYSVNVENETNDTDIQTIEENIEKKEEPLNIDLKTETEKETAEVEKKTEEKPQKETEFKTYEEEEIEISFEDDLEEIREILENQNAFNETINEELQKASEELGIDIKDLEEWYQQLLEQIKDEKKTIYKNLDKKDYGSLHESYHKLKGAALNLRLSKIALILKKLDELSKNKDSIEKIRQITDDFYNLVENKPVKQPIKPTKKNKSDKIIESIILETIKNYLKTQNYEQFEKDKKYIEKLLNVKIDSIEDLQNIIKGQ